MKHRGDENIENHLQGNNCLDVPSNSWKLNQKKCMTIRRRINGLIFGLRESVKLPIDGVLDFERIASVLRHRLYASIAKGYISYSFDTVISQLQTRFQVKLLPHIMRAHHIEVGF